MRPRRIDAVRGLAYAAAALFLVAVGLGRMRAEPATRRVPAPVRQVGFGVVIAGPDGTRANLIDLETGRSGRVALPPGDELYLASCSPWSDGGGPQLVGRWTRRDAHALPTACGLIRLALPAGRVLGQVETDILPITPPCWYPGTAPRILYAAADGALHHYAFGEGADPGDKAPGVVAWRDLPAGVAAVRIVDAAWPADPALGGCLLVSAFARPTDRAAGPESPALWWLRLDRSGTAVAAAGRLVRRDEPTGAEPWERLPAAGRSADGTPRLAYLERAAEESGWRVVVAPIRADGAGGAPAVHRAEGRVLAEGCGAVAPSFSADGRWLAGITAGGPPPSTVRRLPLDPTPTLALQDRAAPGPVRPAP